MLRETNGSVYSKCSLFIQATAQGRAMLAIIQNSALGLWIQLGGAAKQLALLPLARAAATRHTPVSDYADHTKKKPDTITVSHLKLS